MNKHALPNLCVFKAAMETKIATLATDWQERSSVYAEKSKMSRVRKIHMSTFCLSSFTGFTPHREVAK